MCACLGDWRMCECECECEEWTIDLLALYLTAPFKWLPAIWTVGRNHWASWMCEGERESKKEKTASEEKDAHRLCSYLLRSAEERRRELWIAECVSVCVWWLWIHGKCVSLSFSLSISLSVSILAAIKQSKARKGKRKRVEEDGADTDNGSLGSLTRPLLSTASIFACSW